MGGGALVDLGSNLWMTLPAICELASKRQWVCWKRQKRKGKETKIPYQPNGKPASATGAATWSEMPTCFTEFVAGKFDGLGYVLTEDDGVVCVDLDHCIRDDGTIEPWAAKIVADLNSYTEISPGGDGLHIWCHANVSFTGRRSGKIEVYASGRYITVTAQPWEDEDTLRERTNAIEKLVADFPDPVQPALMASGATFSIDPEAEPPALKFVALLTNEKRFKSSWEHSRRDLGDQSLSSYDMSLATLAAYADWTDQEIANLLIAHRRERGNPEKALRSDYLQRTLTRARQATAVKLKDHEAAEVHRVGETREISVQEGLEELSTLLALNVTRVVQRGLDPAFFTLETNAGEIHIGSAEILLSSSKARAKIIAKSPYIPAMKKRDWEHVVALICQLREHETLGEGQRDTEARSWIEGYFASKTRSQPEDKEGLLRAITMDAKSFIWEDTVYLRIGHFAVYLFKFLGVKVPLNTLAQRISEIGWEPHRFRVRGESGTRKECNTWVERGGKDTPPETE